MVTVCLTSIVKNESKIIERMLGSVLNIIDFVNLCDTGSEDDTVELAENFLKEHKIPFKINHHEWENFGHNRNLSIISAKKNFPAADYLFFMDADMKIEIDSSFDKNKLTEYGYKILQYNSVQNYYNLRFAKNSLDWVCIGRTHEYYKCKDIPENTQAPNLNTIRINDIGDGGCKADKFERDERLLVQDLKDNPKSERTLFYLGQTYQCLNKFDLSIELYKKRIEAGGWFEEVYISYLRIGENYTKMKNFDMAMLWLLKGYNYRPVRAECIFQACKIAKETNQHHVAYMLALQGIKIKYPENDVLFIDKISHGWGMHFELSISAFYTGHHEIGLASCYKVLFDKNVPGHVKELTIKNLKHYLNKGGLDHKAFAETLKQCT